MSFARQGLMSPLGARLSHIGPGGLHRVVVPGEVTQQDGDPGCCLAEYLDQSVAAYTGDQPLVDQQALRLGDLDWQVVGSTGHTHGHLVLWQPADRILAVGDALSSYDVGWVNLAIDGPEAARLALGSLQKLSDLQPRLILPGHGPIRAAAFGEALRRAQRLVNDPDEAVCMASAASSATPS
jgi:glyoxylase-like metal-dependent hydrolase (beta-lactamase superfamily II)